MAHLFVDISSHGFGHLAQTAPVLNALAKARPDCRLTVRCALPVEKLRARIAAPFAHIPARSDFGFVMRDAVTLDLPATGAAYRAFHADWANRVAHEAAFLRTHQPDLVLTNAAYLPLAGAAACGLPALSMCSLNWADLFAHFFGNAPWAPAIHDAILNAYRSAQHFLRLTPAMPMRDFARTRAIGPVAALGMPQREALRMRIGAAPGDRIVLTAFGGFDKNLDAATWPTMPGLHWLIPAAWDIARPGMTALESVGLDFCTLLCSVDAILTKPGYGTFVEAACNGIPILYVRRDDWPEQECLIDWLTTHARCAEIDATALMSGQVSAVLETLCAQAAKPRPTPCGAEEAARHLAAYLP